MIKLSKKFKLYYLYVIVCFLWLCVIFKIFDISLLVMICVIILISMLCGVLCWLIKELITNE